MKTVSVDEATADFSVILRFVKAGEEVELTRHRRPIAKIVPVKKKQRRVDWAGTWAKVDKIFNGKSAKGKPGSQIITEGRR